MVAGSGIWDKSALTWIISALRCLSQIHRSSQSMPVPVDTHPMVLDLSCVPAVVLIVEDEMMLRMHAVDLVEDAGYRLVEAVDADEAIAILESRSDIALMCTDIQMPGSMDGLGLAQTVHKRWPSIKIIVVSGQLNPPRTDLPACSRFFGKPLEAGQMITEMHSIIGHT
jgi:CheY-like chemotaxis protein